MLYFINASTYVRDLIMGANVGGREVPYGNDIYFMKLIFQDLKKLINTEADLVEDIYEINFNNEIESIYNNLDKEEVESLNNIRACIELEIYLLHKYIGHHNIRKHHDELDMEVIEYINTHTGVILKELNYFQEELNKINK